MSRTPCRSKQALLRGLRPNPMSTSPVSPTSPSVTLCGVCPTRCIYCDIWKLATLVSSHVPLSHRLSSSSNKSHHSSSSSSRNEIDHPTYKMIEIQFQTQRARLSSIMSICTVDGAEESEGLRIAHDRCLGSVTELMRQEMIVQQQSRPTRISRDCGSIRGYYADERGMNRIGLAN